MNAFLLFIEHKTERVLIFKCFPSANFLPLSAFLLFLRMGSSGSGVAGVWAAFCCRLGSIGDNFSWQSGRRRVHRWWWYSKRTLVAVCLQKFVATTVYDCWNICILADLNLRHHLRIYHPGKVRWRTFKSTSEKALISKCFGLNPAEKRQINMKIPLFEVKSCETSTLTRN